MPFMSWEQHALRRAGRFALAAAVSLALVAPPASADGMDLWYECRAGNGVSPNHSQEDFDDALTNPPADGSEYSDCEDQIRTAQAQMQAGGSNNNGNNNGGGAGPTGGGTGGGGTASSAVTPQALQQALAAGGVDPAAPPQAAANAAPPPPVTVDGEEVDLSEGRLPSLAGALSLPLPLAASGVVVLIAAALPVARYLVARFGGPPTGTTPAS